MCTREEDWEVCVDCKKDLRLSKLAKETACYKVKNTSTPKGYCPEGWTIKRTTHSKGRACKECYAKNNTKK